MLHKRIHLSTTEQDRVDYEAKRDQEFLDAINERCMSIRDSVLGGLLIFVTAFIALALVK